MKYHLSISFYFLLCINSVALAGDKHASSDHDHTHHNETAHTHDGHGHDDQTIAKSVANADSKQQAEKSHNACTENIDVKVNGLVCDFCAQAVEKVFRKRAEVKDIKVDLSTGEIGIQLDKNQSLDDKVLSKMILDSGYNVVEIKRGC